MARQHTVRALEPQAFAAESQYGRSRRYAALPQKARNEVSFGIRAAKMFVYPARHGVRRLRIGAPESAHLQAAPSRPQGGRRSGAA